MMKIKYTKTGSWFLYQTKEIKKFHKDQIVEVDRIDARTGISTGMYDLYFSDGTVAKGCEKRWEVIEHNKQQVKSTFWVRSNELQYVDFDNGSRRFNKNELVEVVKWEQYTDDHTFYDIQLVDGLFGRVYSRRFSPVDSPSTQPSTSMDRGSELHADLESSLIQFDSNNKTPMDTKTMQAAVDNINNQAAEQYAQQAKNIAENIARHQASKAYSVKQYDEMIASEQAKARALTMKVVTIADVFGAEAVVDVKETTASA